MPEPFVVWFTGLSGSGKTTLSARVADELAKAGLKVETLDGDKLRALSPGTGFSRAEREEHVRRAGALASDLEKKGYTVVASLISPFAESRSYVRGLCRNFVEVHVSTPLEECEKRDVKGLYARARRGEIAEFTGISSPYEPPVKPELRLDTSKQSLDESLRQVLKVLSRYVEKN
jgi:adenylylsulfate kinase